MTRLDMVGRIMLFEIVAPAVIHYHNVIDNPQRFIDLANSMPDEWTQARLAGENAGSVNLEYRNSRTIAVDVHLNSPVEWFELSKAVWECGKHYSRQFDVPYSHMENLQILHYETGEGFYKPHCDDSVYHPRVFSSVTYLNDVDEGGETAFTMFDKSIKPEAGSVLMFPANFAYTHQAMKPISGDKYIAVTWFKPLYLSTVDNSPIL